MITFNSPHCAEQYTVPDDTAGKTGQCATCAAQFTIPLAADAPVEAPAGGGFDLAPVGGDVFVPPPMPGGFDLAPVSPAAVGGDVFVPPPLIPPPPPAPAPGSVEIDPCPRCGVRVAVLEADVGLDVDCPECKTTYPAVRPGTAAPARRSRSAPADRPKSVSDAFDNLNRRPDSGRRSRRADADDGPTYGVADDDDDRPTRPTKRYTDLNDDDDDRPARRSRRRDEDDDVLDRPIRTRGGSPRHGGGNSALGAVSLGLALVAVPVGLCAYPPVGAVIAVAGIGCGIAALRTSGRGMGAAGAGVGGVALVGTVLLTLGLFLARSVPTTPATRPFGPPQPEFGPNPPFGPNFQPGQRFNPKTGKWE